MKLSCLVDYLQGIIPIELLKEVISEQVEEWGKTQEEDGGVFPYKIEEDLKEFLIQKDHVKRMCLDYLGDRLNEAELDFLANLLMFIECANEMWRFESSQLEGTVSFIANPESAGPLTKPFIQEILEKEILQSSR